MALSKKDLEMIAEIVSRTKGRDTEEDRQRNRSNHHLNRLAVGMFGNLGGIGVGAIGGMSPANLAGGSALAAMELNTRVFKQAAQTIGTLDATAANLATSFGKMVGMPDSVANLGGAMGGLLSPLKLVRVGFDGLAAVFSLNPIDKIKAPFDLIKVTFESLAEVSKALVAVFMDMRDPAKMLGGVLSTFSAQVGKYNPGIIDRFNLALENLSAASGRIFEPLFESARDFADELNVLYTAVGPSFRDAIIELIPPLMTLGRQVAMSVTRAFIELMPVLTPLVEIFSSVGQALARAGELIISRLSPAIGHLVSSFQPLADAFIESLPEFIGLAVSIGELILYIARGLIPTMQALTYAAADAARGLTDLALYLRDLARGRGFVGSTTEFFGRLYSRGGNAEDDAARNARSFINRPALNPLHGPVTIAAQEARQINIEQVGAEARTRAFSQAAVIQEEIRDFTRRGAEALERLLEIERGRGPGTTAPSGPVAPTM